MAAQMRITLIGKDGTVSFGAEGHIAKMILAACARNVATTDEVLDVLTTLDPESASQLRIGLSRFDEFVVKDDPGSIDEWVVDHDPTDDTIFRLIDPRMREATLTPLALGIVMFNLPDKRVVQIDNRYGTLLRKDRGRMRREGRPIAQIYRYDLPDDWSLVP